ncbi:class I glutamine amidotransferase-like protein [Ilyonectria robusta]|uniref:class I glutamine amidotransferase-like protein n=1 Tax=Ilyonectria robusta TaxID=1079257 RepID=UPI001E8E9AB2|nr:class I glutamine amidotransferase-like protein [Ilyonectria robusta]KAH8736998.1 class I glutamine amidotransferase-like protein [Ilyonectria robusta]
MSAKQVRIGVFIPSGAQALDVATVDVLAVMSKEYLGILPMLPAHMAELAPSVTISYITTPEQGPEIPLTAHMTIKATHSYEEPEVAPGQLDIVIIPGPDPFDPLEEGGLKWLRAQFETPGVDILSVCTGLYICGAAGILKGKTASGPRGLQDDLIKKFPGVKLVGEKYRWVQDGNLWSSGGITNGNDLMAAYAKACGRWAQPVAELGPVLTDVGDRGQIYGESPNRFLLGIAWTLIRGWFASFGSSSPKDKSV